MVGWACGASGATGDVQYMHRRAPTGIMLRHSGHWRSVGPLAGVTSPASRLDGATTRKYTAVAMTTKDTMALKKSP